MTVREAIRRSFALLSERDRRLFALSVVIQMATSFLDLVGVLLIGLIGALAVTTIQSQPPSPPVEGVANAIGLGGLTSQQLITVFALSAAFILLTKSLVSSYLTRRVLRFLANRQALVSARLSRALLSQPLTFVQRRSSQETAFALIAGAGAATIGILGQVVIALTELAVLVVLGVALLFLSPWIAFGSIGFFAVVAFTIQRAVGGWAARAGRITSEAEIASLGAVQEALAAYREITVSNRRTAYVSRIHDLRWQAAQVSADTLFIGLFPKYIFEAALVIGGFALAGFLFATQNSVAAVGTLALFLAASTRVMPSLLRLQGAILGLRGAAGVAGPTFALAHELGSRTDDPQRIADLTIIRDRIRRGHPDFNPDIQLSGVTLTYPGAPRPAIRDVSLAIQAGQSIGLVGRSGAGKSTLADIILGVVEPEKGTATIGGTDPATCIKTWPGGMGYVPQDVVLANDTVRGNVALGLPLAAIDDDLVWEALARAHLDEYLRGHRDGLDTLIGEDGVKLSGGQRQRLGIARALYTRPRLLVLDEATSALDAETELAIAQTISELEGNVTTVVIAHRLSTIRNVDLLIYLEQGRVLAAGTFNEVRSRVPALQRQAELMGLT